MDYLDNILKGLTRYQQSNMPPAVEDPANDYERSINAWYELQQLQEELKKLTKALNAEERKQREAICESLAQFLKSGPGLKEGVNNYTLSNGRALKYTHGIDRSVETPEVANVREAYKSVATEGDPTFDSLLRIKYELEIKPFRKLSKAAAKAVSRMVVSKQKASVLSVD